MNSQNPYCNVKKLHGLLDQAQQRQSRLRKNLDVILFLLFLSLGANLFAVVAIAAALLYWR